MASYVKSDEIQVFPSGFRGTNWVQSKFTSEQNLISFFGKLSKNENNNRFYFKDTTTSPITHYIGIDGYIFVIKKSTLPGTSAFIKLLDKEQASTLWGRRSIGNVLDNIASSGSTLDSANDETSEFRGLGFGSQVESGCIGFELGTGQPLRLDSDEIRNITSGTPTTGSIHDSFTTDHINGCELVEGPSGFTLTGGTSATKTATISDNINIAATVAISSGSTVNINSPVTVASTATVSINKSVTINSPLTIGATSTNTGEVIIESAGSAGTVIIGPNFGKINLPKNPTSTGTYAFITSASGTNTITPGMRLIESVNAPTLTPTAANGSIVARDGEGHTAIQTIHTTHIRNYGTNHYLKFYNTPTGDVCCLTINNPNTAASTATATVGTAVIRGGLNINASTASNGNIVTSGPIHCGGALNVQGSISVSSAFSVSTTVTSGATYNSMQLYSRSTSDEKNILDVGSGSGGHQGQLRVWGAAIGSCRLEVGTTTITASLPITCSEAVTADRFVSSCPNTFLEINTFANIGETPNFKVTSKGNVTANTYNATSDIRKKENIVEFTPAKSILGLNVKKFDYIDGPKNQIGCIAQDLKEICPEIVNEDNEGYLTIQENKLVYLLLEEVKQLRKEVNELKNK